MLEINVDVIPFGVKTLRRTIGHIKIARIKKDENNIGCYKVTISDDNGLLKTITIKNFDRSKGFWELLKEVINTL